MAFWVQPSGVAGQVNAPAWPARGTRCAGSFGETPMAIMAPSIQIVKRADGRSSVAFAAYRAAALLYDERTGERFDYTRKAGVLHTAILAPDHAPDWVYDRQQLWANVELAAKRQDAQVAREFMLPLPHELTADERRELVLAFAREVFVAKGMIADIAIHLPDRRSDQRNHHAHITCTMRHITPDGFGKQAREWNDDFAGMKKLYALRKAGKEDEALAWEQELRVTRPIFDWREKWAAHINRCLERGGHAVRVDHRSWIEQGIDRQAEPHVGVEATNLERKGEETRLGEERRKAQEQNAQIEQNAQEAEVISLALERKKRQARDDHRAAAALDRTRQALTELEAFDKGHAVINGYDRQISEALSEVRRIENRKRYADTLLKQVEADFDAIYGEGASRARGKFWKDADKIGIHKAVSLLRHDAGRYGALPGWQLGNLYSSQGRKEALATLAASAERARQGHFMRKKYREAEQPRRDKLQARIAALKLKQAKVFEAPPEGRLIIQRAIYETARHLRREDWQKLTGRERYHVTQARQLMKHEDLRQWADERARTLVRSAIGPAPAPDLQYLSEPVDLKKASPSYHKAELDKLWKEAQARHEADRQAVAAAEKAAREGLRARHVKVTQKGFLAMLVRTAGLQHVFNTVFARQQRKLQERFAATRQAMDGRHVQEIAAIRDEYQTVRERVQARLAELKRRTGQDEGAAHGATDRHRRKREETARDITAPKHVKRYGEFRENKADITEKKSRGTRRGDVRGPHKDPGQGYGYRRPNRKPPKPDDDNNQS